MDSIQHVCVIHHSSITGFNCYEKKTAIKIILRLTWNQICCIFQLKLAILTDSEKGKSKLTPVKYINRMEQHDVTRHAGNPLYIFEALSLVVCRVTNRKQHCWTSEDINSSCYKQLRPRRYETLTAVKILLHIHYNKTKYAFAEWSTYQQQSQLCLPCSCRTVKNQKE